MGLNWDFGVILGDLGVIWGLSDVTLFTYVVANRAHGDERVKFGV